MNNRWSQGFTIIELMMSIMVLAVLAFVAAPNMRDMLERNKIETNAISLMRAMVAARTEAISRNQPVVMCSSTDGTNCSTGGWDSGWISYTDEDDDGSLDAGDEVLAVNMLADTLTVRSDSSNPDILSFNSHGSLEQTASIRVCGPAADKDVAYTISISVTGRPRSSKGASPCP